jgi:hypothetical protein
MPYNPIIPASGVAGFNYLKRTRSEQQALFQASPEIKRDLAAFTSQIQSIHTSDALLDNYQLFKVALGAFGLDDDINNRGFMKAVLDSNPEDPASFVNRLADKRYLEFARAFNFAGSNGPQLDELQTVDTIKAKIEALSSADDLVADRDLLRAALDTFGLGGDQSNSHFLKLVLNSDLTDPASFANRLSDDRYAAFAESFGFGARMRSQNDVFSFAETLAGSLADIGTASDLIADQDLLSATAQFYGLDADVSDTRFWKRVLESDLTDPFSFANRQDDPRFTAIARAFELPRNPDATTQSKMERFVEAMSKRPEPYADVSDFFNDFDALFSVMDIMNLPSSGRSVQYTGRVLSSEPSNPTSLINLEPDPRYAALQTALNFQPADTGHSYPTGFADVIAQRYVDQQFEIQVGERDPAMRIALAFDRNIDDVVSNGRSVNSRWYAVMASGPLRAVFETVFGLPDGFGTLDVDQQLKVFKDRSEAAFGTNDVAELNVPELREQIRTSYLFRSDLALQSPTANGSALLSLLAS